MGVSQSDFAKQFGYTQGYVNQVLLGKKNLSANFIFEISNGIKNLDLNWLIRGTGQMFLDTYHLEQPVTAVQEPEHKYQQGRGVLEEMQQQIAALQIEMERVKQRK
jgi:transcriptional regulator with XRE-family HTH domain